jgi:hypothetical protein
MMTAELVPTITAAEAAKRLGFATKQSIYDLVRDNQLTAFINNGSGWEVYDPSKPDSNEVPNRTWYFDAEQASAWDKDHQAQEKAPPARPYTEELKIKVLEITYELIVRDYFKAREIAEPMLQRLAVVVTKTLNRPGIEDIPNDVLQSILGVYALGDTDESEMAQLAFEFIQAKRANRTNGVIRKQVIRIMHERHNTSVNSYRFYQKVAHVLSDAKIPFSGKYKDVARRRARSVAV